MRLGKLIIRYLVVILLCVAFQFTTTAKFMAQTDTQVKDKLTDIKPVTAADLARLQSSADEFIKIFRKTLDFGQAFDKMSSEKSTTAIKATGLFESLGVSNDLIKKLDQQTLLELYKAEMNVYYLRLSHDLFFGPEHTPTQVTKFVNASKYRSLLSNGWTGEFYKISNKPDLRRYVLALNKIAALYRAHLPKNVFETTRYLSAVAELNRRRNFKPGYKDGWDEAGVESDTKVYAVERDVFLFTFIQEKSVFRVLLLTPET